ncbi:MAG: nucleotidyltransferase family protein [Bradymonadaceae bacterium]
MTKKGVIGGILCAGLGTRLRPLTEVLPKPLLPFLNTPLVAYALNHLASAGVSRVGVNLHHLPDTIPFVVDRLSGQFGLVPTYVREWEILGTAGGIRGIWQSLGDPHSTLVVLNGDSIMNIDLSAQIEAHQASGAKATIIVRPKKDDQPGRVWLDEEGQLQGLRDMRHPEAPADSALVEHDFTGVHLLEPELLENIPLEFGCMVGDVYGPMLEAGDAIRTAINDDFWAALDTPRHFLEMTRQILDDPSLFEQAPLPEPLSDGLYVYASDGIDDKAQLAGPVLTGFHAEIGAGAKVGPYAIIDGAKIAPGAVVRNAMVYGMGAVEGDWVDCMAVAGKVVSLENE